MDLSGEWIPMTAYYSELEVLVVQVALRVFFKGMVPHERTWFLVLVAGGVVVGGLQEVLPVLVTPYIQGSGGLTYVLMLNNLFLFCS